MTCALRSILRGLTAWSADHSRKAHLAQTHASFYYFHLFLEPTKTPLRHQRVCIKIVLVVEESVAVAVMAPCVCTGGGSFCHSYGAILVAIFVPANKGSVIVVEAKRRKADCILLTAETCVWHSSST